MSPSTSESKPLAALLLTGGASRRMGFDKARMTIGGEPLAWRIARLAADVADPVLEVGPGRTELSRVSEAAPGSGPLAAIADGVRALRERGFPGAALILATDLPVLNLKTLRTLATHPGDASVVPVLDGHPQPLCARWSAADLDAVPGLVAAGQRSMWGLLERTSVRYIETLGPFVADADTPQDLTALGLDWRAP